MRPLTCSSFLLLVLGRLYLLALPFLLGICPHSPWSLPFPLHALALIPLTLAHLDSLPPHDLVLWTDGSDPFPFGKGVSGVLANCALSVALKPLFPFRQAQYVQVFPLKPAPFRKLFTGLGNTKKSAIFLLFSSYLTLVLSSPSFLLSQLCGRSGRNCLLSPPLLSGYNGSLDTHFSRGTTRLMS